MKRFHIQHQNRLAITLSHGTEKALLPGKEAPAGIVGFKRHRTDAVHGIGPKADRS
jgi:hypothetical protein